MWLVAADAQEIAAVREKIEVEVRKVELGEDDIANTEVGPFSTRDIL